MRIGHEAGVPDDLLPESMLRLYPYGLATGCEPITLFRGDDYGFGGVSLVERRKGSALPQMTNEQFESNEFKDTAKFVENTVKTAGKEVGKVVKPIQNAVGDVSKEVGKIPIIGGLVQGVFDLTYMATMWPTELAISIVIDGKRIDNAVLDTLKREVQSVKEVAPYAQMVIAIVPGIGPGVSAALSAGLALAEGQPIEEILQAGLIGALPGGPLVKAAVTMSVETIRQVTSGQPINLTSLAQTAGGIAGSALGLPIAAKNTLMAGIAAMGAVIDGKPLDKALTDAAIANLPVSKSVKDAVTQATALTLDLANGQKLDRALLARIDNVANLLPSGNPLRETIKTGISSTKKLAEGKSPENVMFAALQSGIGDSLVSMGAIKLPKAVKNGLKSGVALATGVVAQARKADQIVQRIPGKLIESGIQLAKADPLFGAARKIAATQGGTRGFDLASGLTQHQAKVFDVTTARNSLSTAVDKLGFDLACATRVGAVSNPKPDTRSAEAHAGYAITKGMQGYVPNKKQVIMSNVEKLPPAAAGATAAIKEVAKARSSILSAIRGFR
jgi:hypothetical protein